MVWLLSQHLVVCVLLAAVVAIVCRAFRLSPAARHALWFVVLLKVMLPLPMSWPWEIPAPSAWFAKAPALEEAPLSADPTIRIPPLPRDGPVVGAEPATPQPPVGPVAPRVRVPGLTVANASRGALSLWALASAAILATQFIKHTRYLGKSRANRPTPEWLSKSAARIGGRLGIPTPEIRVAESAPSPYVYGLLRTRLIIPEALLDAVPRDRWDCILTHELAHLKRRDHWVRWVELIAGGVWFWNPVYWTARRNLRANAELACDAWVVWAMPDQRRAYAETLIDVSELVSKAVVPIAALGIGARGVRIDFERRLTMILHASNTQRTTWKTAALAIGFALAALPGWSQASVLIRK